MFFRIYRETLSRFVRRFNNALKQCGMKDYKFRYYWEHALEEGSHSRGVAYVGIEHNNEVYFGVSISENINTAAINALMNAINKSYIEEEIKNGDDYDAENISQTC
ncbi:alpha-isopropylmalate synthase regulatory domain-containing protein [Clostridioides difficile]